MAAYLFLLRDEYPPYSINADARPGNEVVSAIIGLPLFVVLRRASSSCRSSACFARSKTTVHVQLVNPGQRVPSRAPSGEANNTRITLLDYDDDGDAAVRLAQRQRSATVSSSFHVRAEKDGRFPTFFSPCFLSRCTTAATRILAYQTSSARTRRFAVRASGVRRQHEGDVYFEIPRSTARRANSATHAGLGEVHFNFSGP